MEISRQWGEGTAPKWGILKYLVKVIPRQKYSE